MTFNYYIKCPMCGTVTRMRSPAGYIYETPVRIHCGNCNCLLTGVFISDNKNVRCYFKPINCNTVSSSKYDFYGESSGELLIHKICAQSEKYGIMPFPPPAFKFMMNADITTCERYIDYANHISEIQKIWDERMFIYDLLSNKNMSIIKNKYSTKAQRWGLSLCSDYEVISFVILEYLYDFSLLFGQDKLEALLIDIHYEVNHMNKFELNNYVEELMSDERLLQCQRDMFSIMKQYIKIALNIMPALSAIFYTDKSRIDKSEYGISTCSLEDIKQFYIDCFEILAGYSDIIKHMDNIKYRDRKNDFGALTNETEYKKMSKGNRIKKLDPNEFFSSIFNMNDNSNALRNALVHGSYKYYGIRQLIKYTNSTSTFETYLLDLAVSCIELMKTSIITEIIVYELLGRYYLKNDEKIWLHPMYYKKTSGKNHCPCGSGKKYRQCCKQRVDSMKKEVSRIYIPIKISMSSRIK